MLAFKQLKLFVCTNETHGLNELNERYGFFRTLFGGKALVK